MEPGYDRASPQDNAPSSVRRVRSDGPQHVTVQGRDEVVVVAAEDDRRLRGAQTVAATALHHGLTVVTRASGGHEKTGASLIDPWQE